MKCVMYHYVRRPDPSAPTLRALHVEDFRRQLDFFESRFRLPTLQEFLASLGGEAELPDDAVVLTFDDGLADHHRVVFDELVRRDTFGIFYVPTQPLQRGVPLAVHRIHWLVAAVEGSRLLEQTAGLIEGGMLSPGAEELFDEVAYARQDDDQSVKSVKRLLNYVLGYEHREAVLDGLMALNGLSFPTDTFYLSADQIVDMHEAGMLIGSHTVSHPVMSRLSAADQAREIRDSFRLLDDLVGGLPVRTYCHPYGGDRSFSGATLKILEAERCRFSFSVDSRDLRRVDVVERTHALPRYDCNEFPHGAVRRSSIT